MFGTDWIEDYMRAGNSSTGYEELAKLARHKSFRIRMRVAENPAAPAEVLELLATDSHPDVRLAVATNLSTPVDLVYALALDEDPTFRLGMAEDAQMPVGVLRILCRDENAYVNTRAAKTLEAIRRERMAPRHETGRLSRWPAQNIERYA